MVNMTTYAYAYLTNGLVDLSRYLVEYQSSLAYMYTEFIQERQREQSKTEAYGYLKVLESEKNDYRCLNNDLKFDQQHQAETSKVHVTTRPAIASSHPNNSDTTENTTNVPSCRFTNTNNMVYTLFLVIFMIVLF